MAKNKRTPHQIEADRAEISRLYLMHHSQAEIASKLGLSQPQISYDLAAVRQRWRKETCMDIDTAKAEALAKLDEVERNCWRAWEKSKTSSVRQTSDKERLRRVETLTRDGDPRFLAQIFSCISMRCKILGLDVKAGCSDVSGNGEYRGGEIVIFKLPDNGRPVLDTTPAEPQSV